jgi:phage terminase small subunit
MCWINEAKFNSDEWYCETNLNVKEDGSSRIHVLAWSQGTKLKQTTTWDLNTKVEETKKSSLQSFQNIGNDLNMKLQKATKPILAL